MVLEVDVTSLGLLNIHLFLQLRVSGLYLLRLRRLFVIDKRPRRLCPHDSCVVTIRSFPRPSLLIRPRTDSGVESIEKIVPRERTGKVVWVEDQTWSAGRRSVGVVGHEKLLLDRQ